MEFAVRYWERSILGNQIKGRAKHLTEDEIVSKFKAQVEKVFHGAATDIFPKPAFGLAIFFSLLLQNSK